MEELIKCTKCGEEKPKSEYQKRIYYTKPKCKKCINQEVRDRYMNDEKYREKCIKRQRWLYEYDENHRKRVSETNKRYREEHPDVPKRAMKKFIESGKKKESDVVYYQKNKEKIKKRSNEYYHDNHEKCLERQKEYVENNKEKVKERNKIRRSKLEYKEKKNAREKRLMRENINYKISCRLRTRFKDALSGRRKSASAVRDLGCSIEEFKERFESMFYDNPRTGEKMSWDNYGVPANGSEGWHVDHIVPFAAFDLTKREEQLKAIHHTNLQPLWELDNLMKSSKLDYEIQKQVA